MEKIKYVINNERNGWHFKNLLEKIWKKRNRKKNFKKKKRKKEK